MTGDVPRAVVPMAPPGRYQRPLRPGWIVAEAMATLRARFGLIIPVAATVTVLSFVFDLFVEHVGHEVTADRPILGVVATAAALVATGASTLGSTLLAGLLDTTVGEHQHGHPPETFGHVLRHLPWVTLIVADVLVWTMRLAGLLLLVVPGLILFTLTAIVGPVIMLERNGPIASIRRSIALVRPQFWLVTLLATLPLLGEGLLSDLIETLPFAHDLLGHIVVLVVLEVPVATFVVLMEVTLAYELIERDAPGTVAAAAHL